MNRSRWMKWAKCAVSLPLLLCATGCWDAIEIEQRSLILGLAIDKAEPNFEAKINPSTHPRGTDPSPDTTGYKITVQIALPGKIPLGPGESGGKSGGGADKNVWIVGVSGHSIDDAISNLQQQVAYRLFWGHTRVIIISEAVAREGVENLNDYLTRNPEMRRTKWLTVTRGKAEDILRLQPPIGRVPTSYLVNTFDNAVKMGKLPENFAGIFWGHSAKRGQEGFLPMISLKEEENVEISGMAVFKGNRMVLALEPLAIAQYMAIKNINPGGYRAVFPYKGTTMSIDSTYRASKIKMKIKNGLPEYDVDIFIELNLEEKSNENVAVTSQQVLHDILDSVMPVVTNEYKKNIQRTKQAGADIYGFGEIVRAKQPGFWNRHVKTKENWQRMYKDVKINIHISGSIRRIGMKAK